MLFIIKNRIRPEINQEYFLEDVIGIVTVLHIGQSHTVNSPLVTLDDGLNTFVLNKSISHRCPPYIINSNFYPKRLQ